MKTSIYQLFVRHFGNLNTKRKPNGTISENGCGKFADITDKALAAIAGMGFTHVWLTGALEHACGTSYAGQPAVDEKLLKGKAGSPYAVMDYFDVAADLALDSEDRINEFQLLLGRCHAAGLKVLIDFIPNHVARAYKSDVRPELSFGEGDDTAKFFDVDNHFYYLEAGKNLVLPGGEYPEEQPARVTGNNAISHTPGQFDWYETVKLNYGFDFTNGTKTFENREKQPKTWRTMDEIIAYWQGLGVDGFRCDMAHMVPMEFWRWAVKRAKAREQKVCFFAEAYDTDPMKVTHGNVLDELLDAGFEGVYDSKSYDLVKGIYEKGKWANDLDDVLFDEKRLHSMLRYAENHDEVRLASPKHWGGNGARVGMPVCAFLFGIGQGASLFYNGQEVGEPAIGAEGYSGDDGRTSIFDYTSLPELQKWVYGHCYSGFDLSEEQKALREWYLSWMNLIQQPAFAAGKTYGLNASNKHNPSYGRLTGETCSGHWLYSFLRYDEIADQAYLVAINFHPKETLKDITIELPEAAREWLGGYDFERVEFERMCPCDVIAYCLKKGKQQQKNTV